MAKRKPKLDLNSPEYKLIELKERIKRKKIEMDAVYMEHASMVAEYQRMLVKNVFDINKIKREKI
jgi:hypothetical protein